MRPVTARFPANPFARAGKERHSVTAVKVCGLTRDRDVRLCLELGVHYTGFIFVPESPRYITPEAAARLPRGRALRVGVFAGQSAREILAVMRVAGLDYAQLHGGEAHSLCSQVGRERVIKTLWPDRVGLDALHEEMKEFAPVCSMFLMDAGSSGGGSGRTFDWSRFQEFSPPRPWFLAGGLHPGNIQEAMRCCAPHALDCNSGLETRPGIKDEEKLRAAVLATAIPRSSTGRL